MRPAGHGFHHLGLVALGLNVVHLVGQHVPEAKTSVALDHQKLLGLGMVVMPAPRDARVRRKKAELTSLWGFEHFHKHATNIAMRGHAIDKFIHRQVTHIGGIQRPDQAGAHALRHQGAAAVFKGVDLV